MGDPQDKLGKRRIGVLTSGGDAQGMNGLVRAVVRMAIHCDCEAFAIHEGYEGLVQGGDMIRPVVWEDVRGWLARGGTLIGSARSASFRERSGRLQAAKNMVLSGIDALVVCGGDGSLTGADVFRKEWSGLLAELVATGQLTSEQIAPYVALNIVGVLGSIDNDFSGTDATIGCYSALTRICEAIDDVFDTATSHKRGFVIEVMGRHCGWLALMAAISTGADWLFIPEMPPRDGWEDNMCSIITKNRNRGKRRTIVIVAEGAQTRQLEHISSSTVKDLLSKRLGLDTRVTVLGHIQRGGPPCAYDRWLSTLQGVTAVKTLLSMRPNSPSPVVTVREHKITTASLEEAVSLTKEANASIGAKQFERAMQLRDPEFMEYHRTYRYLTTADHPRLMLSPENRMRIAIIHVGAPAGGMNAATRAAVAYCLTKGHTPIAIHNGFPGLCRHHADQPISSVQEVEWLEADNWVNEGGSAIGTNGGLPSEDLATTAYCFEKYKFDALFVIGGFEAFTAVHELREARAQYAAFEIPIVLLPATMANNVPGTDYSLGSDTSLNTLVSFCDVVRQSASSSRHCVFVIDAQGGESGHHATATALATGAVTVYTAEAGLHMDRLSRDIAFLRHSFAQDHGANHAGKIIIRNECASHTYNAKVAARMMKEEARGRFDAQFIVPGHYQQGGKPTPIDRIRAFRMAIKCIEHIESFASSSSPSAEATRAAIVADPLSVAVLGFRGSHVQLSPFAGPAGVEAETDWPHRRPKKEPWRELQTLVDVLSGRAAMDGDAVDPRWGCYECPAEPTEVDGL